jgi:glycerol kinase
MASEWILAVDQGTTNTKALLFDKEGKAVFKSASSVVLIQPLPGFVEHDPIALWQSTCDVLRNCAAYAKDAKAKIAGIAISNQRETAVAWHAESGEPLGNAVSWQCNRSARICERLASHAVTIRTKTGLPLAPLISASKWAWLLENNTRVQAACREGNLRFGNVDSWLLHQLTGGKAHATDLTNASRTGLLNLESLDWDSELLALFGIPRAAMPKLQSSSGEFGMCEPIQELRGVPVMAAIGDSHAAMFGHGHFRPGSMKATYGTGSSLMALTEDLPADTPALARTVAWSIGDTTQFALEGNIAMTGSAVQWVGEFLGFADPAKEVARLASSIDDSAGVYFVPAMVGLGAPHWDSEARGAITGLIRNHTAAHLARAAIEAIAFQVADVAFAIESVSREEFTELLADGGATRNSMLMQFQADILGRPVLRSLNEELSAIGAAWLAGLALGWWSSTSEIASLVSAGERFAPAMLEATRKALHTGWAEAVARVRRRGEART